MTVLTCLCFLGQTYLAETCEMVKHYKPDAII